MNRPFPSRRPASRGAIPDVIFVVLIINGVMFAAQNLIDGPRLVGPVSYYLSLWPMGSEQFHPWQFITYGFLHGDIPHIAFNMLMLWMFGRELEGLMGPQRFLTYYLTCVIGAGFVQMLVAAWQGGTYPTLGASGGVFGILLAFGMAFPNRMILLLIPPIPMKAKYLVVLAGLMELYFGVAGTRPGIANFAHLGGMLFGLMLLLYWKRSARR